MEKISKDLKVLIDAWISHKYWTSSCEDEAIDWCNHQGYYTLSPSELEDFLKWRDKMKSIKNQLSNLVSSHNYKDLEKVLLAL